MLFELDVIRFLHQYRTPFLDELVGLFDFFDRQEFFFMLIPILWLNKGWKAGYRLYAIIVASFFINYSFKKDFFSFPRPFHVDPGLGIIQVGEEGFPSGAAQSVIFFQEYC